MMSNDNTAVDLNWLCNWLDENSSGIYRPAKEAAHVIRELQERLRTADDAHLKVCAENAKLRQQIEASQKQVPAATVKKWQGSMARKCNVELTVEVPQGGETFLVGTKLYAAPVVPAQQEWQPITTAPEDTLVWLYKPKGKFQGELYTSGLFRNGWILNGLPTPDCAPTHWIPLPAQPQSEVKPS